MTGSEMTKRKRPTAAEVREAHMRETREKYKRERREYVTEIVNEFRGESTGETLANFATEVIRLRRGYRVLAEAVSEIREGRMIITMPQGPVKPDIKPYRTEDIEEGFIDSLAGEDRRA